MKIESTRRDHYLTMAMCGSGAIGLVGSSVHADVYHDSNTYHLTLSSGWEYLNVPNGGASFRLTGSRSSWSTVSHSEWSYGSANRSRLEYSYTIWTNMNFGVDGMDFALVNQNDAIDSGLGFINANLFERQGSSEFSIRRSYYDGELVSSNRNSNVQQSFFGILGQGDRAFFGFELETNSGDTVYGWADFSVSSDGLTLTLHGWAYDTTGGSILAGQTEASTPVPGIGGLGALALGAAGMRRKRKKLA
ncbi:MAG: hypothetical protein MK100_09980 [Phycisphaerales bacterium]|nr:hypothetical protein [Phycisphaerales bacterium]